MSLFLCFTGIPLCRMIKIRGMRTWIRITYSFYVWHLFLRWCIYFKIWNLISYTTSISYRFGLGKFCIASRKIFFVLFCKGDTGRRVCVWGSEGQLFDKQEKSRKNCDVIVASHWCQITAITIMNKKGLFSICPIFTLVWLSRRDSTVKLLWMIV